MRRHLTYANVTATLALVVALSGTAVAAQGYVITSVKQIAPKARAQLMKPGPRGPAGPVGPAGSAVAYGRIAADGTIDAAYTRGVGSVTKPSTGSYCIRPAAGVSFAGKRAVVSVDYFGDSNAVARSWMTDDCPGVVVVTAQLASLSGDGSSGLADEPFTFIVP